MTPRRRYEPPHLWTLDPAEPPHPFNRKRDTKALPYAETYAEHVKSCAVCARCPDWTCIEVSWPPPYAVGARLLDRWNRAAAMLVADGGRDTPEVAS